MRTIPSPHGRRAARALRASVIWLVLAIALPAFAIERKLTAPDGAASDGFGGAVALSGDTAMIGARGDADLGFGSGSASFYVLDAGLWVLQDKVTASDGAFGDFFAGSVAIDGDTAIAGAAGEDAGGSAAGAAYVFARSGDEWGEQQKLVAIEAAAGDQFGASVAVSGDTAVVGAPFADGVGAAYVFVRTGSIWTQQARLTADDGEAGDEFGRAVAIDGDTAIVGAVLDDDAADDAGAVYVYTRSGSTWSEQTKLVSPDGTPSGWFGIAVGLDGDAAVVGAPQVEQLAGAAYVFERVGSTWSPAIELLPTLNKRGDGLGGAVSIAGDVAVVGAPGIDLGSSFGYEAGGAYVFDRGASLWLERAAFLASDAASGDALGAAISISGARFLVGAPGDDDAGSGAGAAYVYDVPVPEPSAAPAACTALLALGAQRARCSGARPRKIVERSR